MFIKKGTIFHFCNLNQKQLNQICRKDRNKYKLFKNAKIQYMICLRKNDDTHFICAPISNRANKFDIPLEIIENERLWVNCATLDSVHIGFLEVMKQSDNYLYGLVSDIYDNHE